jgi:hypothetical protein
LSIAQVNLSLGAGRGGQRNLLPHESGFAPFPVLPQGLVVASVNAGGILSLAFPCFFGPVSLRLLLYACCESVTLPWSVWEGEMQDEKKPAPKTTPKRMPDEPAKPLVTQIVEAVVDGAADIVKGVAIDAVARVATSAKKTEIGKAAASVANKATVEFRPGLTRFSISR